MWMEAAFGNDALPDQVVVAIKESRTVHRLQISPTRFWSALLAEGRLIEREAFESYLAFARHESITHHSSVKSEAT